MKVEFDYNFRIKVTKKKKRIKQIIFTITRLQYNHPVLFSSFFFYKISSSSIQIYINMSSKVPPFITPSPISNPN